MNPLQTTKMTNFRWVICGLLFLATTVNYMDRQVLSLTWKDFISPDFHWTDAHYGYITGLFSIFYAVANLFAGKFIDWMGTKKGYLWAIFIWSLGACLHAACGWGAIGLAGGSIVALTTISVWLFLACRLILAVGEAGNFPAAIKVTAEYFPKKDRAFSTSIFNSGASVGALAAPATIPLLARAWGWEMAFIIIGVLGFIWMWLWVWLYEKPTKNKRVNQAELNYIEQDNDNLAEVQNREADKEEKTIPFWKCFMYKQTWSFIVGKLLTDGVWWFFLFWAPAYFSDQYGYTSDSTMGILLILTLYAIVTILSIGGGYLPTYFVEKRGMNPYLGRMRAMLIFACFPLLGLLAQPLGGISVWWPAILIGFLGAGHQAWSANLFSTIGDMFPKSTIATVTGIGAMAGGLGSFAINMGSGVLFTFAAGSFVLNGATGDAEEMSVKNYKKVLTYELLAEGEDVVTARFNALPDQEKALASFEKNRKRGGSFFDEYATRAAIIEEESGVSLSNDEKADARLIEEKFNGLADKSAAVAEFALRKDLSAKAEIVVNTAATDDFKELAADGEKLATAFKNHQCEIKQAPLHALGFNGKPGAYMIVFCFCAVAYLIGWVIMKTLVPKYKPIVVE
jgi:ACS family hexuronate transporter-like MFS transporter